MDINLKTNIKVSKISRRLSLQIGMLMLSFAGILLLSNLLLLKPLYDYSIKNNMVEGARAIQEIEVGSDNWVEEVNLLNPNHNYDIMIVKDKQVIYSSLRAFGMKDMENDRSKRSNRLIPEEHIRNKKNVGNGIYTGELISPADEVDLYVVTAVGQSGMRIHLTQGVEPIRQSVYQANILLGLVTLVFLLIAMVFTSRISKNFTQPIRDMKLHLNKLSQLEFEDKLEIDTNDELSALSEDVNALANKLESALDKLQTQNTQLEKDIEFQKKFISNASHELRTPLALIKGYSDEMNKGFIKDRNLEKKYMGYIVDESTKMNRLLNELLELSRLESGHLTFKPTRQNVQDCVQSFIEKYSGFIDENNLKLEVELINIEGYFDPVRFEQVLANYLSNAAKYSDHHKKVKIKVEVVAERIRVTVINTGDPIPEEQVEHIWEGFYKVDESRSSNKDSYGLGLSIVKAIQEHAGQKYGCYNGEASVAFWFEVNKI